jgi:hypothetical protein
MGPMLLQSKFAAAFGHFVASELDGPELTLVCATKTNREFVTTSVGIALFESPGL